MDLSILAAVGSFVVSERMLPPKAVVLTGLGLLLCHDLATHSNDPASLRIYRGPGLLAFALFCSALSLRLWRRNGIACDELIFLPGTPFEDEHLRHGPIDVELENLLPSNVSNSPLALSLISSSMGGICRTRTTSATSCSSYIDFEYETGVSGDSAQLEDETDKREGSNGGGVCGDSGGGCHQEGGESSKEQLSCGNDQQKEGCGEESEQDVLMRRFLCGFRLDRFGFFQRYLYRRAPSDADDDGRGGDAFSESRADDDGGGGGGNGEDDGHWAYAPSGASVLGAALDLSLPVFFNFHLFITALNHPRYAEVNTPKIFPLIFLSVLTLRACVPPGKRRRFWGSLRYTMAAPLFRVKFRDEIIGEILTSMVRPIQDVVFSYFYYATVLIYGVSDAADICERSRLLHVLVLPACAICPLWWRFLQTLRQSRDARRRWPYLGNSLKYFTAAMIVLYDMAHPERGEVSSVVVKEDGSSPLVGSSRKMWWVLAFLAATLYQIWWDTFMDWELFVITPKPGKSSCETWTDHCIATLQQEAPPTPTDSSSWLSNARSCLVSSTWWRPCPLLASCGLFLQRNVLHPLSKLRRKYCVCFGDRVSLRPRRMYKQESMYWIIFGLNSLLRFCWMMSFIPAKHISPSTGGVVYSFSADVQSYVGPIVACAEIFRRCLWGLLRVELESIRLYHPITMENDEEQGSSDDSNLMIGTVSSAEQEKEDLMATEKCSSSASKVHSAGASGNVGPPGSPQRRNPQGGGGAADGVVAAVGNVGVGGSPTATFAARVAARFDACLDKTLTCELFLWAVAFVALGLRAVYV